GAGLLLGSVGDGGDVAQVHRELAALPDDEVEELAGSRDARIDLRDAVVEAAADRPGRQVLVLGLQDRDDAIDADAVRTQTLGIDQDLNLAHLAADDGGTPDAARGLQALDDDLVGQRGQILHALLVGAHADRQDRLIVRIEAYDLRLIDLLAEQGGERRDLLAHVLQRDGRVHRQIELDADQRASLIRRRGDGLDAADGVHRLLDLARHVALDRFR